MLAGEFGLLEAATPEREPDERVRGVDASPSAVVGSASAAMGATTSTSDWSHRRAVAGPLVNGARIATAPRFRAE
jgi:hypothetical protein